MICGLYSADKQIVNASLLATYSTHCGAVREFRGGRLTVSLGLWQRLVAHPDHPDDPFELGSDAVEEQFDLVELLALQAWDLVETALNGVL